MRWDIGAALLFIAGCVTASVWWAPSQDPKVEAPIPPPPPGLVLDPPPGFVLDHQPQAGDAMTLARPGAADQLNEQAMRDWERQQQREAAYQQQRAVRELAEEVRSLKQD